VVGDAVRVRAVGLWLAAVDTADSPLLGHRASGDLQRGGRHDDVAPSAAAGIVSNWSATAPSTI
jgi:hypothetical protein